MTYKGQANDKISSAIDSAEAKRQQMIKEREEREREHEKKKAEHKDELAKEEPLVLESSETDPEFPAMEEFEVDEGGDPGTHDPKRGIIWGLIASAAVVVLVVAFMAFGDWSWTGIA